MVHVGRPDESYIFYDLFTCYLLELYYWSYGIPRIETQKLAYQLAAISLISFSPHFVDTLDRWWRHINRNASYLWPASRSTKNMHFSLPQYLEFYRLTSAFRHSLLGNCGIYRSCGFRVVRYAHRNLLFFFFFF